MDTKDPESPMCFVSLSPFAEKERNNNSTNIRTIRLPFRSCTHIDFVKRHAQTFFFEIQMKKIIIKVDADTYENVPMCFGTTMKPFKII